MVHWVDIDHHLVELCRRHLSWADDPVYNDSRLRYFGADIREFWASNTSLYDVIILDLPDPDVDSLRESESSPEYQLYSRQFMNVLRAHLADGGAFVTHCGPVAPGGDPEQRRAGLQWVTEICREVGLADGAPYHTFIPSFQSEWGFYMSVSPSADSKFPDGLAVMESDAQRAAFFWPRFWYSPFIGHN
jgi:spermidine synthase